MNRHQTVLAIFLLLSTGSMTAQTNTFPSTGNVGIGTTSPGNPLTVNDSAGSDAILIDQNGSAMNIMGGNSSLPWYIYDAMNHGWVLQWNGSALSIPSGSVGIGTTTPAYPLDVAGAIRSSSGGIVFPDGSAQTTAFIPGNSQAFVSTVGASAGQYTLNTNGLWVGDSQYGLNADGGWLRLLNLVPGGYIAFRINEVATSGATPVLTDAMAITGNGNVGIGTTAPSATLEVDGNIKLTSGSGASITFQDGTTQSTAWTGTACGGDYAESVDVTGDRTRYEPGDVLVIDPDTEGNFLKSAQPYSSFVTGIYSTKPGLVGRRQLTDKSHMKDEVPMAMTGIVPTKVSAENGAIKPGDLLVTSSKLGYAMKGTDRSLMLGAVIGKALGHLDSGTGVIEVVVTLQ